MPPFDINLNNTQQHLRGFLQPGGPGPANGKLYGGLDMSWIELEGVEINLSGDISAQYVNDPRRIGGWQAVAKMSSAPTLPNAKMRFSEKKGGIPRALAGLNCLLNYYEVIGSECKNPSDFLSGWDQYVMIYPQGQGTKVSPGARSSWEGKDTLREEIDITWSRNPYPVGQMLFGPQSAGTLTAIQVRDITYGNQAVCGNCGPSNDGTKFLYAVADGGAAAKPLVVYSVDGGQTWTQQTITTGANAEIPTAIDVVGNYLVVLSKAGGGATQSAYHYTDINQLTGVPTSANWVKMSTGFLNTASRGANDMFVVSPNEIWFPADGGYIYKSTDITQGVAVNNAAATVTANLTRMHGYGSTYVVVGATATVIKSTNAGRTWAATTTAPTVGGATAVAVNSPALFWVGGDTGRIWFTQDGGETWVEKTFAGSGAGTVKDIKFATPEVGYFSHSTATPTARLFSTWDGGNSWTNVAPRVNGIAIFNSATRLAIPDSALDSIAANNLAIAGIAANGTDGLVYMGTASIV